MKFVRLKNELKEKIQNVYFIYGEDAFLRSSALNLIKNAANISNEEFNVTTLNIDATEFKDVFSYAEQLPFMSEKRLVVFNLFENKLSKDNIDQLNKYVKNPNPSTCLVIIQAVKDLEVECPATVDCNYLGQATTISWILANAKTLEVEIEKSAAKLLSEVCSYDLTKIDIELKKLASYCQEKKIIQCTDVNSLVVKDLEFQIFALADNICKKNVTATMQMLDVLLAKRENYTYVLSTLTNHFRRLFFAGISTLSVAETAKLFKMKEYAIKMSTEQAKSFKKTALKSAYEKCCEAEYKIKSGQTEIDKTLYNLVFELLNL